MAKHADVPVTTDPTQTFTSFTNSAGQTFMIHGLSPMLPDQITETIKAEWKAAGKTLPTVPTYTVPATEAHEEEVHEHNVTVKDGKITSSTLIVDGDPAQTKANQQTWDAYAKINSEFQGEYSTRLMKKVFLAVVTPPTDKWRAEMEYIGIALPAKGSTAEQYKFVELEVIQSMEDIAMLQVAVLRLAGIIDAAMEATAKASFRNIIKQALAQATNPESPAGDVES